MDSAAKIHFEVYSRKTAKSGFVLELATEDRERAIDTAEELLGHGRAKAVKVTKEIMGADNQFQSVTILNKGEDFRPVGKMPTEESAGPLCTAPQDFYERVARERIGRLLDGWLMRNRCTPFELLHRADLAEQLEAGGTDIMHAIQKLSIPEAQERGVSVHEIIRRWQTLIDQTIQRVMKHARKGAFPDFSKEAFAAAARRLADEPEGAFFLGGGVALAMSQSQHWSLKVERILDLAEGAPEEPRARALAFQVLEQPLSEILGARAGLADLLGPDLDLGASLAAMLRVASPQVVDALAASDGRIFALCPALSSSAERLSGWLSDPVFRTTRTAIAKRVVSEVNSIRRLRPESPAGEIDILRVLALLLTGVAAMGDGVLQQDEVREAFVHRSEALLTTAFVAEFLDSAESVADEIGALTRLAENVTGAANKRKAAQLLLTAVGGVRLDRELRESADSPVAKLASLAELQRGLRRAGLQEEDLTAIGVKIGDVAGPVEADARLIAALARAPTPVAPKLAALLRFATGEAGPIGPVATRARQEILKLIKSPECRAELAATPDALARLKPMLQVVGLAA